MASKEQQLMNNKTMAMPTRIRQVDGLGIRYADTDAGSGPNILLTSPWPESLLAFRRVWPTLATGARLVAIDLPASGTRRPGRTCSRPTPWRSFSAS
jgi:pimeloyl-ACP methyl ester carboxylesterase